MVTGCSGGSASPAAGFTGPGGASQGMNGLIQRHDPLLALRAVTAHPDHHKSWLSPELKADHSSRLLYVSDTGTYDVYILKIPGLKLLGTLTGFSQPQGECSDNAGHVWVTNTGYYSGTHAIYEYAHDGTLINTLNDPTGLPDGCAWDKTTGNLAVTNIFDDGGSQPAGEILVYTEAGGMPAVFTNPDLYYYYSPAYDNHGNLFVDGEGGYPYPFVLAELPKDGGSAFTIHVTGGTIYDPGGIQWYAPGSYLIIGDQECGGNPTAESSCLDWVLVSGSSATITGSTQLNNSMGTPACDVVQTVRSGVGVYGGDIEYPPSEPYCASGGSGSVPTAAYHWDYPAGHDPLRGSTNTQSEPDGAAISSAIGADSKK
jgi:hypothetical protein